MWGCIGEAEDIQSLFEENEYSLSFITPWHPPARFCQKLSAQLSLNVKLEYMVPDEDVCGEYIFSNGELSSETHQETISREKYEDWGYNPDDFICEE
jgi:hypothetical protein